MADKEGARAASIVFRIVALVLVVAATVVMGTASQVVVADGRRGWTSYVVVSYRHYNALVYFVAAGVIAAVCTASGLYLSAVNAKPTTGFGALVPLLDVLAQGFLFSAAGAAFATRGDASPAGATWAATSGGGGGGSVCDAAGAFCGRVTVAAGVGAVAAVAVAVAALARDGGLRSFGRCCDF